MMSRHARLSAPGHVFHLVSRFARDDWWLDRAGARAAYLVGLEGAVEQSYADFPCLHSVLNTASQGGQPHVFFTVSSV